MKNLFKKNLKTQYSNGEQTPRVLLKDNTKKRLFYIGLLALPLLQYLIFYIYVNFNSIMLAFQKIELSVNESGQVEGRYYAFIGWDNFFGNFKDVINSLFNDSSLTIALKNSAIAYVVSVFISLPLALIFSYYIAKKFTCSKIFKVILFLPSMISGVILIFIFRTLMDSVFPYLICKIRGVDIVANPNEIMKYQFTGNTDNMFTILIIYNIFLSFSINVILYSGGMSGVSPELIEAGRLDGVSDFKEFYYILIPSIWPTISTFLISGVAGFFINQLALYDLFEIHAPGQTWTLGYYLYRNTVATAEEATTDFPHLATFGIVFTIIAVPITLLVKYCLEKFGPSEE